MNKDMKHLRAEEGRVAVVSSKWVITAGAAILVASVATVLS